MMEPSRRKQEGEDEEDEEEEEEYMEREEEEEVALVAGVDEEEEEGGDDNVVAVAAAAAAACNIPHMHLFMYLKRRFPGLKDAFITDAIQRFGLDRTRCEDELARKSQEQPRSYYSLWNRSRTNSRGSTSSRSSPYSPSEAYPPLQNGNSHHSTPHSAQPSFSLNRCYPDINKENPQPFLDFGFDAGKQFEDSEPPPPLLFENRKYSSPQLSEGVFGGVSNGFSNPRELPTSAPIIPEPREPLFDRLSPCRRKSAATVSPEREPRTTTREDRFIFHQTAEEEIPLKIFSPAKEFSRSPSPSPSPTNTSTPTMSPPSNASSPPTTHTSLSASPVNGQKVPHQQILQQQHQESPSGTKHVTSLHFVPSLPHGAHHNPVPPSGDDDALCVGGGRSYTSVNLQLRQPSSSPQPPINIRSDGSSLSYSTSSLDHRQGSRSSLQISIGPTGGSISAMRTNLKADPQANTAFHIQYSSSESKDAPPPPPPPPPQRTAVVRSSRSSSCSSSCSSSSSLLLFKERRGDSLSRGSVPPMLCSKPRPHSCYCGSTESGESVPAPRPRRTSLPEATGPPPAPPPPPPSFPLPPSPFQNLHYPPYAHPVGPENITFTQRTYPVESSWAVDPLLVEATIQEQIARKDKLKEELSKRIDEKSKLETEVKNLTEELESRERNQRSEVIRCKKEIEQIQQENSKLQFVCDEMERKILESGESPKTDQEGRFAGTRQQPLSPNELSSPNAHFQDSPLRIQLPKQLASASSTSSLSSGGIGTPTPTTLVPSRKAPSPPISSPLSPSRVSRIRGYEQGEGRTETTIGGGDDIGKEWSCSKCTFINSPYLNVCEICGYPHFSLGTAPHQLPSQNTHTAPTSSSTPNPGGPCYCHHRRHHNINHEHRNAGEMQDIHIQVRHQNLHSPMREI